MAFRLAVIDWDGTNLPAEFKKLPPGMYCVEPIADGKIGVYEDEYELTPEEEQGIIEAIEDVEKNGGIPLEDVICEMREKYP